ncbi:MAG: hypothetical protein R3E95_00325 [Thiolinea sp.]
MRLAVLVQMAGVVILALGIPDVFHGLEDGWQVHNEVMVLGYVVVVAFGCERPVATLPAARPV